MKNFYEKSDMILPEKVITLEDFKYGTYVKCAIPALTPFLDISSPVSNKEKLTDSKIENKNPKDLNISNYSNSNFIKIFIPKLLDDTEEGEGKKGDCFIGVFVGGDINKISIVGRCWNEK